MTKTDFVKIIAPVAEYYGRTLSDAALQVYYEAAKEISAQAFEHLVRMHIAHPEQGRFFPTLAHVAAQAGEESDIARQAGIDFDNEPNIDGTGWFDCNHETKHDREQRRRKYIAKCVDQWRSAPALERIAHSENIPIRYRTPMLKAIGSIKLLENDHG